MNFAPVRKRARLAELLQQDYGIAIRTVPEPVAVRCPWHADSGKSLVVHPIEGSFRCLASECGRRGNTALYLSFTRGIPIQEAAELVADYSDVKAVGMAVLSKLRREVRSDVVETFGWLMALPLPKYGGKQVADAMVPSAEEEVVWCGALIGFKADWSARTIKVAPSHPTLLKAIADSDRPGLDVRRTLLSLPSVKRQSRVTWKFADRVERFCLEVPMRSVGIKPPQDADRVFQQRSDRGDLLATPTRLAYATPGLRFMPPAARRRSCDTGCMPDVRMSLSCQRFRAGCCSRLAQGPAWVRSDRRDSRRTPRRPGTAQSAYQPQARISGSLLLMAAPPPALSR